MFNKTKYIKKARAYLEKSVDFVLLVAIDISLLKQREVRHKTMTRANIFESVHNFGFILPWLLETELVTRESNNS